MDLSGVGVVNGEDGGNGDDDDDYINNEDGHHLKSRQVPCLIRDQVIWGN